MFGMSLFIQALAIAISLLYPLYCLGKRDRDKSKWILLMGLWSVALLNISDLLVLVYPYSYLLYSRYSLFLSAALCPVWIVFSHVYYRKFSLAEVPNTQKVLFLLSFVPMALVAFFPVRSFYYSPDFVLEKVLFLEPLAFFFYLQILLFLAVALFNFEATVANAPHGVKWKIKMAVVGSGTVVAVHVLYYSQSLLFRAVDMGFCAARSLGVFVGVIMIMYSELNRGSEERIAISRRLAYRSFVVLFCGLALLIIGIVGEGMKLLGDDFNVYAFTALVFLVCLTLIVLFLSENLRRKMRLMIQRNFYGEKYDYRVEWKKFTDRVVTSKSRDELYANVLRDYCETFGVVGGCILLQGRHDRDYMAVHFHEVDVTPITIPEESELIWFFKSKKFILDMRSGKYSFNEEVDHFLKACDIRFVIPIFTGAQLIGFILLGPPINPVEVYDDEDLELMEAISRQTAAIIANIRLGDELAEARDMEGFGQVATFVLHDLKNQVYPLSLLVDNAREYINAPDFQKDMLDSLSNIVGRMNVLIAQLTNIPNKSQLKLKEIDLMQLAKETARMIPDARIEFVGSEVKAFVDSEEITKVALNLFMNAMEANENKQFQVVVENSGEPTMKVIDFGNGIDREILKEGLFTPFKTTKERGMGIGLYQSKQIVEAHGGSLYATSVRGEGATFSVTFPTVETLPTEPSNL